jgi:tetratricopeptide (TPR) repeat protein
MLYILQRPDEAQMQADLAYRLDPLNPLIQSTYALTLLCESDCASALSVVEEVLASDPDNFLANNVVDAAAFQCGDLDRVFEAEKQKQTLEDGLMNEIERIYNKDGFNAAYEEIMRHLEVRAENYYVTPADMAIKYYMINQDDKVMEWIEKGIEVRDPSTLYIGTGYLNFTRLYDNPRFIKVFEKLNLPLPKSN